MTEAPAPTDAAELRHWRAKEGLRLQELWLTGQTANLLAMETRATAVLTWSVAGVTGLTLAMIGPTARPAMLPAAVLLGMAGAACVYGLWPRSWTSAGFPSLWEENLDLPSITEVMESVATTNVDSIDQNDARLRQFRIALQIAWVLFLAAPLSVLIRAF